MRDLTLWQKSLDPLESETVLAQICIPYLLLTIFEEQSLLIDRRNHGHDDPKTIRPYIEKRIFLEYAAINWTVHFRKTQNELQV